jgi:hypothetical protein
MDELRVNVIFEGKTTEPALLRHVLTLVSTLEPLLPHYWGPSERKRLPWDVEAILSYVAEDKARYRFVVSGIRLWRTKAPRYEGSVLASDRSVNSVELTFSPGPSKKHLQAIYEATERLVESVPTVFAYVQPVWREGPEVDGFVRTDVSRYVWGAGTNEVDMHTQGLMAILPRTWFGPMLVERVGRERLLGIRGAREEAWGGIRVDLVPEPWNAGFKELEAAKEVAMEQLRPSGMFMEVGFKDDGGFTKKEPAPKWTPPDWVMRAKRKDEM